MKINLHDTTRVPFYQRVSYLYIPALFAIASVLLEVIMFAVMGIAFPRAYIFSLSIVMVLVAVVAMIHVKWMQTVICSLLFAWQLTTTISNIIANDACMEIFSLETLKTIQTAFNSTSTISLNLWFLIPIIGLIILYVVGVVLVLVFCRAPKVKRGHLLHTILCGVLAFVSFFSYTIAYAGLPTYQLGAQNYVANLSNEKFLYDTFSNRASTLRTFGSYSYYLDNILKLFGVKVDMTSTMKLKVNETFTANPQATELKDEEVLGEGYNLIMVLMETFERSAINPVTMPNLYKFMQESCTEVDGYYSIERTCFSDHVGQTGMHVAGQELWNNYSHVTVPHSLGNIFKRSNYTTATFHAYDADTYQRGEIFTKRLGFEGFYDYNTYENPHKNDYALNSDKHLFDKNKDKIAPADKPFYSYVIGVSTHSLNAAKNNLGDYYPEYFERIEAPENWDVLTKLYPVLLSSNPLEVLTAKNYLAGTCSFDDGFGILLDYLKTTRSKIDDGKLLIENTALVLFGDHYYYVNPNALEAENENPRALAGNRCPLIVYNPQAKTPDGTTTQAANAVQDHPAKCGRTLARFTSTMDLYPTVCSLFGIQTDQQLTYGHSIFGDEDSIGVGYLGGFTWGASGYLGVTSKDYTYRGVDYHDERKNWQLWRTLDFVDYNGVTLDETQLAAITPLVNRTYESIFLDSMLYDKNGFKKLDKCYQYHLRTA